MDLRTALGRARGLGSAKEGTHHWWHQRLSAIINIPLVIWFISVCLCLIGKDFTYIKSYFASPFQATLMLFFILNIAYHIHLGTRVIIEDYIHTPCLKYTKIIAVHVILIFSVLLAIVSLLKIVFGE